MRHPTAGENQPTRSRGVTAAVRGGGGGGGGVTEGSALIAVFRAVFRDSVQSDTESYVAARHGKRSPRIARKCKQSALKLVAHVTVNSICIHALGGSALCPL